MKSATRGINEIFCNAFYNKHWHNDGNFCNRKTHPILFSYRKYKRGKDRCNVCGAKIGKVKCVMESNSERLSDNLFHPGLLNFLRGKNINL